MGIVLLPKNLIYICFILARKFGTDCKLFYGAQSLNLRENLYIHFRMYRQGLEEIKYWGKHFNVANYWNYWA